METLQGSHGVSVYMYRGEFALVVATVVLPVGQTVTRSPGPVCEMVIRGGRRAHDGTLGLGRPLANRRVWTVREGLGAYWHSKSLTSSNGITRLSWWGRFAWGRHFGVLDIQFMR